MEPCRSTAVYLLRGLLVGLTALSQGARGLELRACFGDWLVLEDGESWRTSVLQHSWGVHAAAAHVNRRDCSIIKSCEQALRIGDDEYITISLKTYETYGLPDVGVYQAQLCVQETRPWAVLGPQKTNVAAPVTLLMGSQGIPAMGVFTSGPELSNVLFYKMYARTSPSETVGITATVSLIKELGWERVAVLYVADAFGSSYAEEFSRFSFSQGVEMLPIPVVRDGTEVPWFTGVEVIKTRGYCIVVLVCADPDIINIADAIIAHELEGKLVVFHTKPQRLAMLNARQLDAMDGSLLYDMSFADSEVPNPVLDLERRAWTEDRLRDAVGNALAPEAPIRDYIVNNKLDQWTNLAYDGVWAVAIGAARAVRALKSEAVHVTNETLARVVGPRIYQEWTSRDFAFKGASGWVEFMPNGDRNATSMNVNFKNYDRRKDPNNTAEGMTSAALWMGDKGLRFSADGFHWGHGRVARPSDRPPSSSSMPWYFTLGIIFCSFLILLGALYLIYLIWGDYRARKSQAALQIDFGELVFGEPVTVLGAGTTGLSLVATYRGLPVVVKQIGTIRKSSKMQQGKLDSKLHLGKLNLNAIETYAESFVGRSMEYRRKDSGEVSAGSQTRSNKDLEVGSPQDQALQSEDTRRRTRSWSDDAHDLAKATALPLVANYQEVAARVAALHHPNIVAVMGLTTAPDNSVCLVTERFQKPPLSELLQNAMVLFDSRACLDISLDIASGVSYMHMSDPAHIHGLLRASNVMLDSKNTAKVADVGMRSLLGECLAEAGTYPLWMAPEVLRGEPCSMASDVYAFGVLLYELWARREPYKDELLEDVVCDVARTPLNAMRVIWKRPVVPEPHHIPDGIIEIMEVCWHQDPARRPSIQAVKRALEEVGSTLPADCEETSTDHGMDRKLLEQILPPHVARLLKTGQEVPAETYDDVTVLFTDIVGFTDISSALKPEQVMDMLHRLYNKFDALTAHFNLFKVETIGDAYMAVGNLHKPHADHTLRMCRFALDLLEAASQVEVLPGGMSSSDGREWGTIRIRVGIHCGPVVASVVGQLNPRYCLFGDTVNTAARMESNSAAMRVHMSEAAKRHLLHQIELSSGTSSGTPPMYRVEKRGNVEIKGKGVMTTYWLLDCPQPVGVETYVW